MYSFSGTDGWYEGRPVASGSSPTNPSSARSSASTKTSIARTGLSSQIQSSRHSGNSVACARSVPSTKRLIRSSRESLARLTRNEAFLHSLGHPRSRRTKPHIRPRPLRPKSDRRKSKFDAPLRATNGHWSLGFNHLSQRASDFAERALRNIGVGIPLVDFDIGRPDHLAPLFGFGGDESSEIGGRARKRRRTQIGEPRFHLGFGKSNVYLPVQLVDDFRGCVLWCGGPEPITSLEAR